MTMASTVVPAMAPSPVSTIRVMPVGVPAEPEVKGGRGRNDDRPGRDDHNRGGAIDHPGRACWRIDRRCRGVHRKWRWCVYRRSNDDRRNDWDADTEAKMNSSSLGGANGPEQECGSENQFFHTCIGRSPGAPLQQVCDIFHSFLLNTRPRKAVLPGSVQLPTGTPCEVRLV